VLELFRTRYSAQRGVQPEPAALPSVALKPQQHANRPARGHWPLTVLPELIHIAECTRPGVGGEAAPGYRPRGGAANSLTTNGLIDI
jgi:hypothetical protein